MNSSHIFERETGQRNLTVIGNNATVTNTSVAERKSESHFIDVFKSEAIDDSTDEMEKSMLGMRSRSTSVSGKLDTVAKENSKTIREQTLLFLIRFLYNRLWRNKDEVSEFQSLFNDATESQNQENKNVIGYTENYFYYNEQEETVFNTTGEVVTADGRSIFFNVEATMSRSFSHEYFSHRDIEAIQSPNMIDPLVINLDNNLASVSDQKFYFDIDSDGVLDSISQLSSSSGFLALDLNDDGKINNGSELFGTKSGNGFKDLALYDKDNNGWIDENDEIFEKLLIWTKDENGKDILYHLKDVGVGAICLKSVNTDFSLNSLRSNRTNAMVRQSGLFLYENGMTGTVQQLDLAR
jgi:hypothetical protein